MAAAKSTTAVATQAGAELVVNNKFIDSLAGQLHSKEQYGLTFPPDYNVDNALNGALTSLKETTDKNGKPLLESCTQASIANSLVSMATMGLSVQKKQGYFVAYGGKCQFIISYFGRQTIARRYGMKDISAEIIYAGDDFEFEIVDAKKRLIRHRQDFKSIGGEIVGAYAVAVMNDGTRMVEVMNIDQIKKAWSQGYGYKEGSGTHAKFPDQMAKKTVINRLCKAITNTHGDIYVTSAVDAADEAEEIDFVAEDVAHDIQTGANVEAFVEPEVVEDVPTKEAAAEETVPVLDPLPDAPADWMS